MAIASLRYEVDATLILAVIAQESMFDASARADFDSGGQPHCFGLMQLHDQGAGLGWPQALLLDPCVNIMIGTGYLRHALDTYPDHLSWGLAAYHQGPGGVRLNGIALSYEYIRLVTWYRALYHMKGDESE